MISSDRKIRVALLSIISNSTLIVLKIIAGIISGSVSIISEAIHSSMDLLASIVAFFSVKASSKPADDKHPYGHGKIENISGIIEGILILIASIMIIVEAIKKIFNPTVIENESIAILVMFISGLTNFFVSSKLYKVAKEEDSMALEADALHLRTDIYTSVGVGIGILLIKITKIHILDSIVAILVAILIIKEAVELTKNGFDELIDKRLSDEEEREIKNIIERYNDQFIDYHKLKTRKSGNFKHIDFHITVESSTTVKEVHEVIGNIKKEMNKNLKNSRVTIHVDPSKD
ncbi:cation diffusion facilitator family transporter [Terrisporobacter mayombei]|uniref:Ferrous-iron efflux pump FieF n=1 Tax=Terrisporobacter mayombei TaxID=1541 RepID=A0ABY9PYF0_9FIRM|nr:cation diffusion facilitator family transporter [Terrisporobacter mayombei]MCC3868216.1 cation diffusion facilitator family transporter [Terrisporobacter mayombei]WMT80356.1 Ferrous-iron efflux pump FieF [Terrisporobacter mayombei]